MVDICYFSSLSQPEQGEWSQDARVSLVILHTADLLSVGSLPHVFLYKSNNYYPVSLLRDETDTHKVPRGPGM